MCIEHVISLEKEEILQPGIAIDQQPKVEKLLENHNEVPNQALEDQEESKLSFDSSDKETTNEAVGLARKSEKQDIGAFIDQN